MSQTIKKYMQLVSSPKIGDCQRACMATLLQLPPEVLPNDHSQYWFIIWAKYLEQFGLEMSPGEVQWLDALWIATVPSLNYKGVLHSIVMHRGGRVFHDPSTKKRYKTGTHLSSDVIQEGTHLDVLDVTKIHLLEEYRRKIREEE